MFSAGVDYAIDALGNFFASPLLYSFRFFAMWGIGLVYLTLLDHLTRDSIDPAKLGILVIFAATSTFAEYADLGGTWTFTTDILGYQTMTILPGGMYYYLMGAGLIYILLLGIIYFGRIITATPRELRHAPEYIALAGVLLFDGGVISLIAIPHVPPFVTPLLCATFVILATIALYMKPRLGHVLPFKLLRLVVVETKGGIPLFSHTWQTGEELGDGNLFAGAIQGITLLLKESLRHGTTREIRLDDAALLVHRDTSFAVAYVLVATKISKDVREHLARFAARFSAEYALTFAHPQLGQTFPGAEELVKEYFPD